MSRGLQEKPNASGQGGMGPLVACQVCERRARGSAAKPPKDSVVDNFYSALWEWPSRWRDYCCHLAPAAAALACGGDWRRARHARWHLAGSQALLQRAAVEKWGLQKAIKELCVKPMREACEMKRAFYGGKARESFIASFWQGADGDDVHPPAAPLRAYRFTSAGGQAAEVVDGVPRGCIFKVGFDEGSGNPYSGKVVIMDEGHHLTRPNMIYQQQLDRLREYVESATGSVFVSCTGSMEADSASDPRMLLDAVKGQLNRQCSDEGFLSSHHKRGPSFPHQSPAPCAEGVYSDQVQRQVTTYVELKGVSLVRYVYQAMKLQREGKPKDTLANYTNIYVYAGSSSQPSCQQTLLYNPDSRPKFAPAMRTVIEAAKKRQKSLVMIGRKTGYKALLALMHHEADQHGFGVAEYEQMAQFNQRSNLQGQHFMVMVLEAEKGGEGIEFLAVRHAIFLDVPWRLADYKQRCGRVVRCGSHNGLSESERTVRFSFLAARFPEFARKDLGAFALFAFCGQWGGPKTIRYTSEPPPEDIISASQEFVRRCAMRGIQNLRVLAEADHLSEDDLVDEGISQKLRSRLEVALDELREDAQSVRGVIATDTFDEEHMDKLKMQFCNVAPALAKIRGGALDVGFY
ncbi:unnamed protein product [Effrenium voratum]|uniref:Helicase C-terminal domain-containing protein n=1 Tax=Effrenium voratum TaxID=2562239 RepID=A0AA36IEZ1_9DINO|nr:unnamed protein product [Effrenium voratum]CAJ1415722.1 unnamed protein product [Effrenium voratum]